MSLKLKTIKTTEDSWRHRLTCQKKKQKITSRYNLRWILSSAQWAKKKTKKQHLLLLWAVVRALLHTNRNVFWWQSAAQLKPSGGFPRAFPIPLSLVYWGWCHWQTAGGRHVVLRKDLLVATFLSELRFLHAVTEPESTCGDDFINSW